jgi:hypothetical protein
MARQSLDFNKIYPCIGDRTFAHAPFHCQKPMAQQSLDFNKIYPCIGDRTFAHASFYGRLLSYKKTRLPTTCKVNTQEVNTQEVNILQVNT